MTTEAGIAYEFIFNPDLPPLPEIAFRTGSDDLVWANSGRKVDWDELDRLGYCRKVRYTTTKEYL